MALIALFSYGAAIKSNFSKVGITQNTTEVPFLSTPQCMHLLNQGKWQHGSCRSIVPLIAPNSADEIPGEFYASKFAHCDIKSWGWPEEGESCQFRERTSSELLRKLSGKKIYIVGDSIGRYVYYALLSELGDPSDDVHNTNQVKHADLEHTIGKNVHEGGLEGNIEISFLWKPFIEDVQDLLQKWRDEDFTPDVLYMNAGLWDALNKRNPDSFKNNLQLLSNNYKQEIEKIPMSIWITPTTIVNERLTSDEKKTYMTEEIVKGYRDLELSSKWINSFKYILNGFELTKDIPQTSFDGVHYEDGIYSTIIQLSMNAYHLTSETRSSSTEVKSKAQPKGYSAKLPDGSTVEIKKGTLMLIVIILMLITCDSYAGIISFFLCVFGKKVVTWKEAYEPLLRKLGIALTRPRYEPVPLDASSGNGSSENSV